MTGHGYAIHTFSVFIYKSRALNKLNLPKNLRHYDDLPIPLHLDELLQNIRQISKTRLLWKELRESLFPLRLCNSPTEITIAGPIRL